MQIIVEIILVIAIIALLVLLFTRKNESANDLSAKLAEFQRQSEESQRMLVAHMREESEAALARQEAASRSELAAIREQYGRQVESLRDQLAEQSAILAETSRLQFENLSNKTLSANLTELRENSRREIDAILAPLRERLAEFTKVVSENHVSETASRQSLSEQIDRLIRLNNTIGEETRSLTSALKGDSKVQGDWGEMILETLLESAGMKKDVTFFVQPARDEAGMALKDDEGNRQRPDVLVKLPDEHLMIIDSKVSLTAYVRLCEAQSPEEEKAAVREHIRSVRKHVDELGAKQYQRHWKKAVDHTLMFVPNEGAYFAAIRHDPELWRYAYDKKVVIVSPTHVFSVMQIISQLWRQESQNRNAESIAELGGKLYDRFVRFNESMMKIRAKLNETGKAFDDAYSQFGESTQSLTRTAERLRDLGAKTSKRLPSETTD